MAANTLHSFFRSAYGETARLTPMMHIEEKKNPFKGLKSNWSYVVPVLCAVGLGCTFLPYFGLGLLVGALDFLLLAPLVSIIGALLKQDESDEDGMEEYFQHVASHSVGTALVAPFVEEVLFRCLLQPLLIGGLVLAVPALATIPFFSTGLSLAAVLGIACTAITFGLMHLLNSKNHGNYTQVINCTLGGVVFGMLAVLFGPAAAIAAHIMNNTIITTLLQLSIYCSNHEKSPDADACHDAAGMVAPAC